MHRGAYDGAEKALSRSLTLGWTRCPAGQVLAPLRHLPCQAGRSSVPPQDLAPTQPSSLGRAGQGSSGILPSRAGPPWVRSLSAFKFRSGFEGR